MVSIKIKAVDSKGNIVPATMLRPGWYGSNNPSLRQLYDPENAEEMAQRSNHSRRGSVLE